MIRISLDVDNARLGVLGGIAQSVHHDAAGDRAIWTGIARLRSARKLEFTHLRDRCSWGEAQEHEARSSQGGARYGQELAPGHVSHGKYPPHACTLFEVYAPG